MRTNHVIRITSGVFRGRKIATPGEGTHPMGERERLALFNMISQYLPGATVLDAFAGSGAIGIEALSRGVSEVVFVESNRAAVRCIAENLISLGFTRDNEAETLFSGRRCINFYLPATDTGEKTKVATVVCAKVQDFETGRSFDIIIADPPYDEYYPAQIEALEAHLREGGALVLSHPGEAPKLPGLTLLKSRSYAGATISVFCRNLLVNYTT